MRRQSSQTARESVEIPQLEPSKKILGFTFLCIAGRERCAHIVSRESIDFFA
jgi:hypothetical protein